MSAPDDHRAPAARTGRADSRRDGKIIFYKLTATGRELIDAHFAVKALVP